MEQLRCRVSVRRDRHGQTRVYFRRGKGARIPLPPDIGTAEFNAAYATALENHGAPKRERGRTVVPGTIAALIISYKKSPAYLGLRETTHVGYSSRLEALRIKHGHRTVSGLTRERIENGILAEYADRPGAALAVLKMLRILIRHAMGLDKSNVLKLDHDPSAGIKRPKTQEIRAWTDNEAAVYE